MAVGRSIMVASVVAAAWVCTAGGSSPPDAEADPRAVVPGSGFVVATEGLVATSWQIVEGARDVRVIFPGAMLVYGAEVASRDVEHGLAILRLRGFDAPLAGCEAIPYGLRDAATLQAGEAVTAVGYPLQEIRGMRAVRTPAVVSGSDTRFLRIDAEVPHGSSGGPVFRGEGDVVGVVVSTHGAGGTYAAEPGTSLAARAEQLIDLLPEPAAEQAEIEPSPTIACIVSIRATK